MDVVNENDEIIGVASREDVYKKSLCHRIAHVLIFDDAGRMVLQKRSDKVSFCPNHWSTAVGGHVQTGESFEMAALREYQEELGTISELELVGKDFYQASDTPNKFLMTFKSQFKGPFNPDPEVISEVCFFTIEEIKKMIENGEKFHPELVYILKKYYL